MATALLHRKRDVHVPDVMAECFFVRYSGTVVVTNFTDLCITWPDAVGCIRADVPCCMTTSGPDVNEVRQERFASKPGLDTSAAARREEVDMVVAGQQRLWIDCCITQPR
ncbi:hypothetical protein O5290_22010 [Escherichia coli]|nr:hypothetical protein [Escherichia coli]